jgi:hypothetical protein
MNQTMHNLIRATLHGVTGAGLFRQLDYPGAPKELVDSRPLEEILASGEFELTCARFGFADIAKQKNNANSG